MKIYISGSVAFDKILNFSGKFSDHILPEKVHMLNVSFMVDDMQEFFGGTALNIGYTLSLLGKLPVVLSSVGKDFDRGKEFFKKNNLSFEGICVIEDSFTAGCFITTDSDSNQITGFNPGAMQHPCDYNFSSLEANNSIAIVSPGNLADMVNLPNFYKEKKVPYIFDPGQQLPVLSAEQTISCLTGAAFLMCNDYEFEMIKNKTGLSEEEIHALVAASVITYGAEGSKIFESGKVISISAASIVKVMDPTGAGDAFRAGFLAGLVNKLSLENAAKLGSVCAAYCVEQKGTLEHSFSLEDLKKRYEENFGASDFWK